ncbi:MAG: 3-deoxy-D-manno-octulosonic acid transferase [Cyanobacteria bacterium]|nr:3-deoxy-D-manno-octulosonic acid transferase [Cyanobacteriota bacterium]MDA1245757.1 3-deoxy-D-manno-octulosonic acid transferase [Cyanobacteriota bacterium]
MKRAQAMLLLGLYRLLSLGLTPLWLMLLLVRLAQDKEDHRRLGERLGWPSRRRPAGPLLWFHAASVGELNSLLPVLRALGQVTGAPVLLVTTVTRTSAALAGRVLPPAAIHQYVPIDNWLAMLPFRCYWRPCLGVLAESELWPELVQAMPHLHLINARMSQRSYLRHRRIPAYASWLLARVEVCLAQSQADAERFKRLGARDVRSLGSTKLDADPPPVNSVHLELLQQVFAGRSVLLLASSHAGEERQWLEAWLENMPMQRPFGLLLAPRHPQRAPEVLAQALERGLSAALWSDLRCGGLAPNLDVLVADVIGEMGTWISAAAAVVMGGSFCPQGRVLGGQNPLEPVALGRPVLCGPDMANFSDLLEPLQAAGCLQQCADVAATLAAALPLLVQPLPPRDGKRVELRGPSELLVSLLLKQCR